MTERLITPLLLLGSGAVDRYLLPADCTAANPPVQRAAGE